ncbi:hypothetical protein [Arcobacter vandammei]|nr:hypothetical protein [Arcobacter vandammei]
MGNVSQGLIVLGTFTAIAALIPILMRIFMKSTNKKDKNFDKSSKLI